MHKPKTNYTYWQVQIVGMRPEAIHAGWHTHTFLIRIPMDKTPGHFRHFVRKQLKKAKEYLYKPTLRYELLQEDSYLVRRKNFGNYLYRMDKHGHVRKENRTKKEREANWNQLPQGRKLND